MKDLLKKASDAYYAGQPFMSDATFDVLSTHFRFEDLGPEGDISHYTRLYSLKKEYGSDEITDIHGCSDLIRTPKLDGSAISLLYVDGNLQLALTRGNGLKGRDITSKAQMLVPDNLPLPGVVQVSGEVVAPMSITNARNFASGALGLKSDEEFRNRIEQGLCFVAYNVDTQNIGNNYKDSLLRLYAYGFNTVLEFDYSAFPTDGIVYRVNDFNKFNELGYTSTHPRGAIALKEDKEGVETTLLDVVWQVGRTGKVTPVAIIDTVEIGGAKVSRASLHNSTFIKELGLEIGCRISVIRAGEIIPEVVSRIDI